MNCDRNETPLDAKNDFRTAYANTIVLLVNVLERFAYYGLLCNYILYLSNRPLYWDLFNSSTLVFVFFGLSHISSVIGGWLADCYLGKYNTITLGFVLYAIGFSLYPILAQNDSNIPAYCLFKGNKSVIDPAYIINGSWNVNSNDFKFKNEDLFDEPCSWLVFLANGLIGFAVSLIKSNIAPFGAEQVSNDKDPQMIFKYFNWLYWCINIGSLGSFLILAYVQQNISFKIGYLIPFFALLLAFLLFVACKLEQSLLLSCLNIQACINLSRLKAKFCFIEKKKEESMLMNVFKVIQCAFNVWKIKRVELQSSSKSIQKEADTISNINNDDSDSISVYSLNNVNHQKQSKSILFLDNAKIRNGGKFDDNLVNDVQSLGKIVVLFLLLVPYWIVYFQIETTFLVQGVHMRLIDFSSDRKFKLPAAWLMIFDQIIIIILIPLLDKLIYPFLVKRLKLEISTRVRMLTGMLFGLASVASAGALETYRLQLIKQENNTLIAQTIDNTTYLAANLTIWWQTPQYTFSGISEVFCSVSGLYYAYSASPKSMRSIIMGLFYLSMGIGSFLGSLIVYLFEGTFFTTSSNTFMNNHLDYYFYCLSGILFVGILVFLIVDSIYSITKLKRDDSNVNRNGTRATNPFFSSSNFRRNYEDILGENESTNYSSLNSINTLS